MSDGRFAPTPSGDLHIGNLRTALLAWLFARSSGSRFLLRIDDIDATTIREGVAESQLDDLRRLGLDWDGPVVHQRDRAEAHGDAIADLVRLGDTYPCFCSRREIREATAAPHGEAPEGAYPGTCRQLTTAERAAREATGRRPALRLRTEGEVVTIVDRLHGAVSAAVDDIVLRRGDGVPAYNMAVVVDDAWQGIGEVVRADDLLLSTPRQVHLARRLGLPVPTFAHVPLVLAPGGARLAKRDGAVTLGDRERRGESPDQVRSWLAESLDLAEPGAPGKQGEVVSMAALLDRFDPARLPTQPWTLTPDRLSG